MKLVDLYEAASEFQTLQKHKVALSDEERAACMKSKAVWHFHGKDKPNPAVWKSVNPKTNKTTFVTNTHRAYQVRPNLKSAISAFHSFIKDTA